MQITESMLGAAVKVAVERGLLPKYDFADKSAENWETIKLMLEAALSADTDMAGEIAS